MEKSNSKAFSVSSKQIGEMNRLVGQATEKALGRSFGARRKSEVVQHSRSDVVPIK